MSATSDPAVADLAAGAIEHCYDSGWTDGLPVVPCSEGLLAEFLAQTNRPPEEVLLEMPALDRRCTVRQAAINAAMAGCRPEYFPVVLAVWESMRLEGYAAGILQSTTGTAPLIVVNGPVRNRLDINASGNVFGPGFRANATIGRAIRLAVLNVLGIRPHELDQSTQGTPAKFTCCIGENEEASPWPAFHEEHGFDRAQSTATVMTLRSAIHIEARHTSEAEQLLDDISQTIARTGSLMFASNASCLVLCPEHAELLASQSWDKPAIRRRLYETAVLTQAQLDRVGKGGISTKQHWRLPSDHADAIADERIGDSGVLHVLTSDTELQIVVAGAANSGVSALFDIFELKTGRPSIVAIGDAGARLTPSAEAALDRIGSLLSTDGFTTDWEVADDGVINFTVGAGTADCADCLVPEPVLATMIGEAIEGTGLRPGSVTMPTEYSTGAHQGS